MKNNVLQSVCVIFLVLLFTSCKKESKNVGLESSPNPYAAKVKKWFESAGRSITSGGDLAARGISSKNDIRDGKPQWDKTRYFEAERIYVTPIVIPGSALVGKSAAYKYLITTLNNNADIESGTFFYLVVDKVNSDSKFLDLLPNDLPGDFFTLKKIPAEFSGAIAAYDIKYNQSVSRVYKKGEIQKQRSKIFGKIKDQYIYIDQPDYLQRAQEINSGEEHCVTYYLVTFETDNETGVVTITDIYEVFTFCENPEQGGGAGNTGPSYSEPPVTTIPPPCNMTQEEAQASLNGVYGTSAENDLRFIDGLQIVPDGSGTIRKPSNPIQGLASIHFFLSYNPHFSAFFKGVVYKMNETDRWKWESCEYNRTSLDDGELPPCFTMTHLVNVSPVVISLDGFDAETRIDFRFYAKVSCAGGWLPEQLAHSGGNIYHFPSDQW